MKQLLKKIDNFLFGSLQNHYARMLEKEVYDCESLLDVGCGSDSPIKYFSKKIKHCVGVDAFQSSIDKSKTKEIHNEYHLMNVLDIDKKFPEKSFDYVIASDLIEHLEKENGFKLIEIMEKLARKKVIIFTPNGFLKQHEYDRNKYQIHLSGWKIDEMKKLGYKITGINGWKFLRGEFAEMRWNPKVFWGRISLISQYFTTRNPKNAFAILCVKEMKKGLMSSVTSPYPIA
ncbi:MAG: class I SAM-dependent methyltransferase [Bacteroidota bacterium]